MIAGDEYVKWTLRHISDGKTFLNGILGRIGTQDGQINQWATKGECWTEM